MRKRQLVRRESRRLLKLYKKAQKEHQTALLFDELDGRSEKALTMVSAVNSYLAHRNG